MDVTDRESVNRAALQVEEQLGSNTLTGLVNNAGIAINGPLLYFPLEDYRRQLEVTGHYDSCYRKGCSIRSLEGRLVWPIRAPQESQGNSRIERLPQLRSMPSSRRHPMPRRFWTCTIITTISALVSAGFSVVGLLAPSSSDSFPSYAASRSIALLIAVLFCLGVRSREGIAALVLVMTLVQGFDGIAPFEGVQKSERELRRKQIRQTPPGNQTNKCPRSRMRRSIPITGGLRRNLA
jgi:hypothetical protein